VSYEAVARALREGDPRELSDLALAARYGCRPALVARVRAELHAPAYRRGKRPTGETLQQAFKARVEPVGGGHLLWVGRISSAGVPVLSWHGEHTTAARVAFKIDTGREPVGQVRATCTYPRCVAPGHQADRLMREALAETLPDEVAA
jgi:hypothetical protein